MKISRKFFIGFFFAIIFSNNLCGMELGTEATEDEEISYDMNNKFKIHEKVVITRSSGDKEYAEVKSIDEKGIHTVQTPKIIKLYSKNPGAGKIDGKNAQILPLSELGKLTGRIIGEKVLSNDVDLIADNFEKIKKARKDNDFEEDEFVVIARNDESYGYAKIDRQSTRKPKYYYTQTDRNLFQDYETKYVYKFKNKPDPDATVDFSTMLESEAVAPMGTKTKLALKNGDPIVVRNGGEYRPAIFDSYTADGKYHVLIKQKNIQRIHIEDIYKIKGLTITGKEPSAAGKAFKSRTKPDLSMISLTEWTSLCFKKYPEYSSSGTNFPDPVLPWEAVEEIENQYIQKHKDSGFFTEAPWIENNNPKETILDPITDSGQPFKDYAFPFVQKKYVAPGSKICFMGDLHGCVHSLLRNILSLVAAGYLNNDFKICKKNFYMVFNGDFVDRGRHGVEVLYTLLRLKLANWNCVFLLRGNHEGYDVSSEYGFAEEVGSKYPTGDKYSVITKLYRLFPLALYLGSGADFVQCCHGGIEIGFSPEKLLTSDDQKKIFQKIPGSWNSDDTYEEEFEKEAWNIIISLVESDTFGGSLKKDTGTNKVRGVTINEYCKKNYEGFNWSDFEQNSTKGKIELNKARGAGYLADVAATRKYLQANNMIKAFFRGHQDKDFGFKMFFDEKIPSSSYPKGYYVGYARGPYRWDKVVQDDKHEDGFLIYKYPPVFTFTSATESQGVPHDCYSILTTAENYNLWRLKPYFLELDPDRNGNYVNWSYVGKKLSLNFSEFPADDPILPSTFKTYAQSLVAVQCKEEVVEMPGKSPVLDLTVALGKLKDNLKKLSAALQK